MLLRESIVLRSEMFRLIDPMDFIKSNIRSPSDRWPPLNGKKSSVYSSSQSRAGACAWAPWAGRSLLQMA